MPETPVSELTLEEARQELRDRRDFFEHPGAESAAREAELEEHIATLLDEPAQELPAFAPQELEKIEAWAATPGVPVSSLPLEYRAAVEHRRDELNAAVLAGGVELRAPLGRDVHGDPVTGHHAGEDLTEEEAEAAIAVELERERQRQPLGAQAAQARGVIIGYRRRQARLDALEVRDTQAARLAKLELDLDEARAALEV